MRNWVLDHSRSLGADRHWILDDNIQYFSVYNNAVHYRVLDGSMFRYIEEWCDQYTNVALAGPHYSMFSPRRAPRPFVTMNHRVYSCILVNNHIPFRWRGKYNEDTDLNLRCLKAGWCTVLFRRFLAHKLASMQLPGGNTDALAYRRGGRLKMAVSLARQHPDVASVGRRWNRPFATNRLIRRPDAQPPTIEFVYARDETIPVPGIKLKIHAGAR